MQPNSESKDTLKDPAAELSRPPRPAAAKASASIVVPAKHHFPQFLHLHKPVGTPGEPGQKKGRDMTVGRAMRNILLFMLPMMLGNVFQQLYAMSDAIIVGQTINENALGGITAQNPIQSLYLGAVIWMLGGFSICTSQFRGAKDAEGVKRSFAHDIMLSVAFTAVMTVVSLVTMDPLLTLLHTQPEQIGYAHDYLTVILAGFAAAVLYNLFSSTLRAIGDSRTPLYFLIATIIMNIGMDLLFIITFKMGIAGAAWATVLSQAVAGAGCAIYALIRFPALRLSPRHFRLDKRLIVRKLAYGLPLALQISLISVGVIFVQFAINDMGAIYVISLSAAGRVENIAGQIMASLGGALSVYAGQNFGARKLKRIDRGDGAGAILSVVFGLATFALTTVLVRPLTLMFLKADTPGLEDIIANARTYLSISGSFYLTLGILYVFRSTLQGVGKNAWVFVGGIVEMAVRVALSLLAAHQNSYLLVCLCSPVTWGVTAVYYVLVYLFYVRGRIRRARLKEINTLRTQRAVAAMAAMGLH
jgi:putative MATE family efflux protein